MHVMCIMLSYTAVLLLWLVCVICCTISHLDITVNIVNSKHYFMYSMI